MPAPATPTMQRGFALVSAIFLIVALAALGVYMARIASIQHTNALQDLQGSAAYQAARSGAEWGAYQITQERAVNAGTGKFAENCRAGVAVVGLPVLSGFSSKAGRLPVRVRAFCAFTKLSLPPPAPA